MKDDVRERYITLLNDLSIKQDVFGEVRAKDLLLHESRDRVYRWIKSMRGLGWIAKRKRGSSTVLSITDKGIRVLEEAREKEKHEEIINWNEANSPLRLLDYQINNTAKVEGILYRIMKWLYLEDGNYDSAKQWRKALVEMIEKELSKLN